MDVGAELNGWYGDAARTYAVGAVSEEASRLMRVTEEALQLGLAQARAGNRVGDISHAVQSHVERHGFSVVRDLVDLLDAAAAPGGPSPACRRAPWPPAGGG